MNDLPRAPPALPARREEELRHFDDERGFLTDQPLDPDGWKLRVVSRSAFYELWDSAGR